MMKNRQMSSSGDTWGWLVTTSEPVRMFSLRSAFTVGRNPSTCDLFIDDKMFEELNHFDEEDYVRISRRQFSIEKRAGEECAVLTDLSMNGTFVHGVRVGKDRQILLEHCSVISLLGQDGEVFRYLDRDTMEDLFPSNLTDKYMVGEILGKGTTSVVRRGYKMVETGEIKTYALKIISTKDDRSDYRMPTDAKTEIRIMESLHHPCILRLDEVFSSPESIILVMERASGGELFEAIVNDRNANKISEQVAKAYFYQIVHCVNYLHQRKLCHRDLKLENILIGKQTF